MLSDGWQNSNTYYLAINKKSTPQLSVSRASKASDERLDVMDRPVWMKSLNYGIGIKRVLLKLTLGHQ